MLWSTQKNVIPFILENIRVVGGGFHDDLRLEVVLE
jgi:hypothetical protein